MKFTDAQHDAIYTHDRPVIVVAGAGSGKTRVLVERYMALLEQNPDWPLNALVAITFTQKAAQEMRDRVRQALQQRLADVGGVDAERWAGLLAAMDSARIDTIHALCATILRANAADAGVDPRFSIIEPIDADLLVSDVIDRVLNALRESDVPEPATKLFSHYDAKQIRDVLDAFATRPLDDMPDTPADIMKHWQQQWRQNATIVVQHARQQPIIAEKLHWATTHTFPAGDKLTAIWDDVQQHLQNLHNGTTLDDHADALYYFAKDIKIDRGKGDLWGGKDTLQEAKDELNTLRGWARELHPLLGERPGHVDEAAAEMLPLWMTLIQRVQHSYAALKSAEDLMDFDDLEHHTANLLTTAPAVRERYLGA
ncbi:MAG: UvrD-helicase domain-containing protein, partial [Chloroflexota bacterium]